MGPSDVEMITHFVGGAIAAGLILGVVLAVLDLIR